MEILRKLLKKYRARMDSGGFTIIEMVVAVPMLALVGGIVVLTMSKTLLVVQENSIATKSAGEIRVVMNEAREVKNCYQLKQLTGEKKIEDTDTESFTITSQIVGNCVAGQTNVFKSQATQDGNSKVLFESTTKVFISE